MRRASEGVEMAPFAVTLPCCAGNGSKGQQEGKRGVQLQSSLTRDERET